MRHLLIAGLAVIATGACSKEPSTSSQGATGLPAKGEVALPQAMPGRMADSHAGADMAGNPHAGADMAGNPHAGADMAGNAHAGADMAGNPHAGVDMAGNPHAGVGMGGAEAQPVDPTKFLKGTITATEVTKGKVKSGAILFIAVKPINPITGEVIGNTLAADRIDVAKLPVEFELTGANLLMAGARFDGDVLITARVDQDGEARTKQPGDVEGEIKAKIPADGLVLSLATVL
jgi:hypothetical protein